MGEKQNSAREKNKKKGKKKRFSGTFDVLGEDTLADADRLTPSIVLKPYIGLDTNLIF